MEKLTPWFDSNVNPVHIGVYERNYHNKTIAYNYWNGKFWGLYSRSRFEAIERKGFKASNQKLPWRGILK